MKILCFLFFGVVGFVSLFVFGLRESHKRMPDELKKIIGLLPDEWKFESWGRWEMGWYARFEVRGRRFQLGSHRGEIELFEMVDGHSYDKQFRLPYIPKSTDQIYELLTKAVA